MATRTATGEWHGDLKSGGGTVKLGSGAFEGAYSFSSRFEDGKGTNPEELLGAAHAGCFSMALAHGLSSAGFKVNSVMTKANVHLISVAGGFSINKIDLVTEASVEGISAEDFAKHAEETKVNCPVSKALLGPEITLDAKLV